MATDPANNAVDVPVNSTVTVVFSDQMNPSTFTDTSFILRNDTVAVTGNISYSDSLATFTPSNNLSFGGIYTATITTGVENLSGITIENNYEWSFTTEEGISDTTQPQVVSTNPANEAENVSVNTEITATFSEPMTPSTINTTTFTITQGETNIPGTVELEDATATFVPDNPLDFNTDYTATVTSDAEDTTGNPLSNITTWSFTTETEPDNAAPEITSNIPADEAVDVSVNASITVTFSEAMNSETINNTTFTLEQGNTAVESAISYSENTATLNPENNLEFDTGYTVTVTTGMQDLNGNSLASNFSWTFTTSEEPDNTAPEVIATNPTEEETDVSVNTNITVTFSEPMNTETINQTTFTIVQGSNSVVGEISVTDTTATFNPSSNLAFDNTFTGTITTGAQDLAGNALASNFSWTFSTGMEPDMTAPEVTSTTPADGEEGVPVTNNIFAVFSEAVNSATIDATTFTVSQGGSTVAGAFSFDGATVTFNPTNNLAPGGEVAVTISTDVADQADNNLASEFSWSFTTEQESTPPVVDSVDPEADATGVPVDSDITAVFSEAVDPSTITETTFDVSQGDESVDGELSIDGATVTFNPTDNFSPNSEISVAITTGVTDQVGNNLANDFEWSFTTEQESTPPVVSSVDPEDGASNVPVGSNITVVFSEAVNTSTINATTVAVSQGGSTVAGELATDEATVTFNPTNNFATGSEVTVTISTGVQDLAGNNLASNFEWSFNTEQESIPPIVASTTPGAGAGQVAVGSNITVTFSEAINPATINSNTFIVSLNSTQIAGEITSEGETATFNPDENLQPGSTYGATITTGVQDLAGNSLQNNFVWSFTTEQESTPPVVNSTSPGDSNTDVPVNTNISATFNEAMDQASVQGAFTVFQGGSAVAGTVTFSGNTAVFNPTNNLSFNTPITVTISTAAQDLAGNSLASDFSWGFTTEQESTPPTVEIVNPANGVTDVAVNASLTVGFSENMNSGTITASTFTVSANGSNIDGTVSSSGSSATFDPAGNLPFGSEVTATITTGVQDLAGNSLESNFTWNFTTEQETTPPTVSNTNPANNATDVPVNSNITAEFSEAMDPSTINENTFTLSQEGTAVSGSVDFSGTTATLDPAENLAFGTVYTATITTGVQDLAGNALTNTVTWNFTTEQESVPPEVTSISPANNATMVPVNTIITATFSEPINPSTINPANFSVSQAGLLVSGSVSYSGNTATFTPSGNLLFGIPYNVIITTGVQDLVGNTLLNNFQWSFTTTPAAVN